MGVFGFQQVLLETLHFSDDAWVAQSKEGLPGSSLCLGHIIWILAKMAHFSALEGGLDFWEHVKQFKGKARVLVSN